MIINQLKELNEKMDSHAREHKEELAQIRDEIKTNHKELSDKLNPTSSGDGLIARVVKIEMVIKGLVWTTCALITGMIALIVNWVKDSFKGH